MDTAKFDGFRGLDVGAVIATVALPIAEYGPGVAFIPTLLGWLVAFLGALVFGVAILRSDVATTPRFGAWLLVAALPVGLPFAIAFTTYVMGEGADPWAGSFLLYGLAWVVFGRYLRSANRRGLPRLRSRATESRCAGRRRIKMPDGSTPFCRRHDSRPAD